ncbi:MAG: helix-turn-helix domain-containing protein [Chloroflexi bacterium]|nr:helix-turn-helix domain-containing protein [Chloroflexota bacterium]
MKTGNYSIGDAAEALGVSTDTVRRLVDEGKLRASRSAGGHRRIAAASLAELMAARGRARSAPRTLLSARNRFPGIVTKVIKDKVAAHVEVQAGPHRLVSLMTREAADELGLKPGVRAVANVKATNVIVELEP